MTGGAHRATVARRIKRPEGGLTQAPRLPQLEAITGGLPAPHGPARAPGLQGGAREADGRGGR